MKFQNVRFRLKACYGAKLAGADQPLSCQYAYRGFWRNIGNAASADLAASSILPHPMQPSHKLTGLKFQGLRRNVKNSLHATHRNPTRTSMRNF